MQRPIRTRIGRLSGRWAGPPGAEVTAAVATAIIVVIATLLRQDGTPKLSTLWAEDGRNFLACAYRDSVLACVATPYQGYLHLAPRIGASIGAIVPPVYVSVVIGVYCSIVGAFAAALAARAIAAATGSWLAAIAGAGGLALVWEAGREVLGNMANLHWILLAATLAVVACKWLGGRLGRSDLILVGLTGMTSALAPLVVLVAIPGAIRRQNLARTALAVAAVTAAVQVVALLASPRIASGDDPLELKLLLKSLLSSVLRDGPFGPNAALLTWFVPIALAALVLLIVATKRRDPASLVRELLPIGAIVTLGFGIYAASAVLNRTVNDRYAYLPSALLVAALAVAAARAATAIGLSRLSGSHHLASRLIVPAMSLVLAIGFSRSFVLTARASAGPDVPQEIRGAGSACAPGIAYVLVDISPKPASDHWTLTIPCDRIADG